MTTARPLILYIPGLLPKPAPRIHRDALRDCLLAAMRRVDAPVADAISGMTDTFDIASWTYEFYGEHRDIALDRASIDAVIEKDEADFDDVREATKWTRRLTRWIYTLGDMLPFLIPHLASERMEVHLRDLMRYEKNKNGITDRIRNLVKIPLLAAAGAERPILLIGHSMGSVIAYDTLWELSHTQGDPVRIDTFLSMGSPLGQRFVQKSLSGHGKPGRERFPTNIRRWKNLTAVGDLTAIDPYLANDFGDMLTLGLVEEIDDEHLFNWFRLDGVLNVHSEYGYLANEKTALTIAKWWRGHVSEMPAAD